MENCVLLVDIISRKEKKPHKGHFFEKIIKMFNKSTIRVEKQHRSKSGMKNLSIFVNTEEKKIHLSKTNGFLAAF